MAQVAHNELTTPEMARRLGLAMSGGKSLRQACSERGWPYAAVYARLYRAGLKDDLMALKYPTEAAR